MNAVEFCCGAGGATIGIHWAGYHSIGYDNWKPAVETQQMNGFEAEVADMKTMRFPEMDVDVMWGSPPCPPFSQAATHSLGNEDPSDCIPDWIRAVDFYRPRLIIMENVQGLASEKHVWYIHWLVSELRKIGYKNIEWQVLNCADYGVPRTRKRFFLIGRRDGKPVEWPIQTHAKDPNENQLPWVTMAQALGWGFALKPAPTITAGGTETGGAEVFGRWSREAMQKALEETVVLRHNQAHTNRPRGTNGKRLTHREDGTGDYYQRYNLDRPAPTLTHASDFWRFESKLDPGMAGRPTANRRFYRGDEPAPTLAFGNNAAKWQWVFDRPSTTIVGSFRPDIVSGPGYRTTGGHSRQNAPGSIRITIGQAAILQGFPFDYHFPGPKTAQFKQIGNAVPPIMSYLLVMANREYVEAPAPSLVLPPEMMEFF